MKIIKNSEKFLLLIFAILIVSSCSQKLIRRNSFVDSRSGHQKNNEFFIKKKVVILKFLNDSPFGGEDLEVTATEHLRKNLLKSNHFLFDYQNSKY